MLVSISALMVRIVHIYLYALTNSYLKLLQIIKIMYYSPANQKISTSGSVNLSIPLVDEENYTRAEPKSVHNSSENTSLTGNMFSYISEKLSQFQYIKSYSITLIQSCYVSKLRFRDESTRGL